MLHLLIPFKRILAKLFGIYLKFSFSQMGEDLLVKFILDALKIQRISYLDIGANHPYNMNNTYLFYLSGMKGVCIEPNPLLFKKLKKTRKRDTCLNIGIGNNGTGMFFIADNPLLSTFSAAEADRLKATGEAQIIASQQIELVNINTLMERYFDQCPDFISLDVEGLDLIILEELDFSKYRPKIFCIETISFSTNLNGTKSREIFNLMEKNNYRAFADTYVNTIFVDNYLFN